MPNELINIELTREDAEKLLYTIMESISLECWFAGWLDRLADDLPELAVMAVTTNQDMGYGASVVEVSEARMMLKLAIALGYWLDYDSKRPINPKLNTFFEELEKVRNEPPKEL